MSSLFTRAAALAAVACAIAAAPASARMYVSTSSSVKASGVADGYVEGYAYTSGQPNNDTFRIDVVRGGSVVGTATDQAYVSLYPFVLQLGDQVVLTNVSTGETHATAFTGLPKLASTVCGTPSTFSGTRDDGATVNVSANVYYGEYDARNDYLPAVTIAGAGTTFSGSFSKTLAPNWDVTVSEARAFGSAFTVFSDTTRPVGACPVAPAPLAPAAVAPKVAAPVRDVVAPRGVLAAQPAVFKPAAAYKALIGGTFVSRVSVTEPGVVTQTLFLDDGATLPKASAAGAKKRPKAKKATVLGTGRVAVAQAGTVKVKVKLSKKGKSRLKHAKALDVALVTTLTDTAGNTRVLPPKRFTAKRTKGAK